MQQENTLTEELKDLTSGSSKMIDNILEVKSNGGNNYDSLTLLYQRIHSFLVYKNKQLSQMTKASQGGHETIQREVNAALESVIPRNALPPFLMLTNAEKATQLAELSSLVLGIRLFNKEIGKGGSSLPDIKALAEKLDKDFLESIRENLLEVGSLVEDYEAFLLYEVENNIEDSSFDTLKNELIFLRQYMAFLANLYEKTESSITILEGAKLKFMKEADDLRSLLSNNSSAPKDRVYPKFSAMSNTYMTLVEESKGAEGKKHLLELLVQNFKEVKLSMSESQMTTAQRINAQSREEERPLRYDNRNQVVFIEPSNTPEFMQSSLDLAGFSLVSLVDNDGLLINGKHSLGLFQFQEDYTLIFNSHQEAQKFMDKPQHYFERLFQLCRRHPALIFLLKLEDYFQERNIKLLDLKEDFLESYKTLVDYSGSTPLHFYNQEGDRNFRNIDKDYLWNEWDIRKKAIQMANIRNMTTKACQTADSIFKVENETQVWLKRDAATNTGIENGTNPIRPRNYITELREKTNN